MATRSSRRRAAPPTELTDFERTQKQLREIELRDMLFQAGRAHSQHVPRPYAPRGPDPAPVMPTRWVPSPGTAGQLGAALMNVRRAADARHAAALDKQCSPQRRAQLEEGWLEARSLLIRVRDGIASSRRHAAMFGGRGDPVKSAKFLAAIFGERIPVWCDGHRPPPGSRTLTRDEYARREHERRRNERDERIAAKTRPVGYQIIDGLIVR
jgi:hypothetical protein